MSAGVPACPREQKYRDTKTVGICIGDVAAGGRPAGGGCGPRTVNAVTFYFIFTEHSPWGQR